MDVMQVLQIERDFEAGLMARPPNPAEFQNVLSEDPYNEWGCPVEPQKPYPTDAERAQKLYPLAGNARQILQARTEKIANHTRERDRERRGKTQMYHRAEEEQGAPRACIGGGDTSADVVDWILRGVSEVVMWGW